LGFFGDSASVYVLFCPWPGALPYSPFSSIPFAGFWIFSFSVTFSDTNSVEPSGFFCSRLLPSGFACVGLFLFFCDLVSFLSTLLQSVPLIAAVHYLFRFYPEHLVHPRLPFSLCTCPGDLVSLAYMREPYGMAWYSPRDKSPEL